ncbi:HAMP domain-containing sensor histidine kinase [Marinomonas sp. 15G1-11]|uniref:histidine kinase n=1 Tax=Marinomonas phaeophyticola TaxID=3004091 RepID=A0ABT4JRE8_9GAMM|nr:HAMP domain-containing sensor histidine kinase [Marinomonas sp. 15G1-11]MCZ2720950.1 HAMP domain-containing sensor histidine kinase [Marinomonas sp. 15G1-11]
MPSKPCLLTVGVDRSTRIVSQLLALARLEHKKEALTTKSDILVITRAMIAAMLPLAWKRDIEIVLNVDDGLSWNCLVETNHIEILLQILISNSIKFSPDGAIISLVWTQSADAAELKVIDTGKGVSKEDIARLSERFFRSGTMDGAGLGLSIVKNIVDKYQGRLSFNGSSPQGLTVTISLPIMI